MLVLKRQNQDTKCKMRKSKRVRTAGRTGTKGTAFSRPASKAHIQAAVCAECKAVCLATCLFPTQFLTAFPGPLEQRYDMDFVPDFMLVTVYEETEQ
jgi:translation initiation factor RLI1